jgi:hypothetical protein
LVFTQPGPGGSGWPGIGPPVGSDDVGAPFPPATPAMSTIGAPGTPPNAIRGAPAGTATGSGAPAPAGTGAPAGNGSPPGIGAPPRTGAPTGSGAPAMSVTAAPAGAHGTAAGAPTSPVAGYMHAPPPVFSGTASASGLSAIAAPHNPTPATTLILHRTKAVIDVNSLFQPGHYPQINTGAAAPQPLLTATSFLVDPCSTRTTPHRTVSK